MFHRDRPPGGPRRIRRAGADVFVNDFVVEDTDLSSMIGLRVAF